MTKMKDLLNKSVDELTAVMEDNQIDLFHLRNQIAMAKKLEKPHVIREKKKDIARIKTILRQKEQRA